MFINPISLEKVKQINPRNLSVAQSYIRRYGDEIEDLQIQKINNRYIINAIISIYYEEYEVKIQLDEEGNIITYTCECPFQHDTIPCAHVIYVLEALKMIDVSNYLLTQEERAKREEERHNQFLLRNTSLFLENYFKSNAQKLNVQLSPNCYKIIANIDENMDGYTLDFKVGNEKMYVIKNLQNFLQAIDNQVEVTYGKKLSFVHSMEVFDEESQKIISFIRAIYAQAFSLRSYYYYRSDGRNIEINSENIDLFYETFYKLSSAYHNAQLGDYELIRIPFTIESYNETLFEFTTPLLSLDHKLFFSNQYIYLKLDGKLYRYQEKTSKALLPIITQLVDDDKFFLDQNMMVKLYYSFLEPNKEYIDMDYSLFINLLDDSYKLKMYLELNSKEQLAIDVNVIGLDGQENPLLDEKDYLRTMSPQIQSLLTFFEALHFTDTKLPHNRFVCEMSVEEFTQNALPYLQELGEVMVSDELLYRDKKTNYSFTTGIHMEGNLLKLTIHSEAITQDEIFHVLRDYRRKKKFYKLKNGDVLNLNSTELEEMSDLLDHLNVSDKDLQNEEIDIPQYRAFTLEEMANYNKEVKVNRSANFAQFVNQFQTSNEVYDIPLSFAGILRDYQKEGYQWLKRMQQYGFGAILADDMGLGKTIQVLALLESNKQKENTSLVVCPASLILNWEDEVKKFSTLSCLCVHGTSATRELLIKDCMDYDIVITSYDFIRRDYELYQDKNFFYIVLDEAQYIKNQSTRNAQCVKELKSTYKLALSGTPIENSLAELWSIFDFLMPNYLYPYSFFKTHYETPIVRFEDKEASAALKHLVSPFILRRIKKDVLKELPDKIESSLIMEFSEEEEKVYVANLALINQELAQEMGTEEYMNKMRILAMMTKLRQLCADPRLVYSNIEEPSTKIQACMDLVKSAFESQKPVLLFSSFTSVLALLEEELHKEGIYYLKLTGDTPKAERHALVEEFQQGNVPVFLISLKAGGTGLNLTAAEIVIHFDPWWNVSAQNQATDRAYRFGQTNNVQVYKLIMKNSIEEKILKLQTMKHELAQAFVEQSETSIASMSREEIMDLFK